MNDFNEPTKRDDGMDALVAAERITTGVVMDDTTQTLTELQRQKIRARVQRLLDNGDVTKAGISRGIAEPKGTVCQVLNGSYRDKGRGANTVDRILRAIDKWITVRESRSTAPRLPEFVSIRLAQDVRAVGRIAVKLTTICAVWAEAGVGKTVALEALRLGLPGSVLITIDDSTNSVASFLKELARLLKMDVSHHRSENRRAVVDGLRERASLLIVDEAHLASAKLLDCIRGIFDASKTIGVLLAGQASLEKKLLAGRGDENVGAMLYSRIKVCCDLQERTRGEDGSPLYTLAEIRRIFAKSSVRLDTGSVQWLQALAVRPELGGLRAATGVVQVAELMNEQASNPVDMFTVDDLERSNNRRLGHDRAVAVNAACKLKRRRA